MDLLPPEFKKMGVFPVGRLDKDTEGLLLLTNDGIWAHSIINGHKTCTEGILCGNLMVNSQKKVLNV